MSEEIRNLLKTISKMEKNLVKRRNQRKIVADGTGGRESEVLQEVLADLTINRKRKRLIFEGEDEHR